MPISDAPRRSFPELRCEYAAAAAHARRTAVLTSVESLLGWDEQTMLPSAGGAYRADQAGAVAALVHAARTEPAQRDRLERLATSMEGVTGDWSDEERVTVSRLLRDLQRQLRLPSRLVEEIARACIDGQQAWIELPAAGRPAAAAFSPRSPGIVRPDSGGENRLRLRPWADRHLGAPVL